METKQVVLNLITALGDQGYSFSESLSSDAFVEGFDYQSGVKRKISETLQAFNKRIVSYEHIDHKAFDRDLRLFQESVDYRMLVGWGYKSGCLSIVGILFADKLSYGELRTIFSRLDDGVTNILRKHTGRVYGGEDGGTYGTMLLVFSDSSKANRFNEKIQEFYNSHFFKSTYTSSICIDCSAQSFTLGKAAMGLKWKGGMDTNALQSRLFI